MPPLPLLLCLALALLVSAACRKSGSQVPIGPTFKGRLILYTERFGESNKIYEIKSDPTTGNINLNVIAESVEDFALSPDGAYLLYTQRSGSETFLRDLGTAELRKLLVKKASVLDWSPDGNQFSYRDDVLHQLVVSNLSGQSQVIDKSWLINVRHASACRLAWELS
ncbi:MAG: hypothetical protein ABI596_08845, partial [Pyrinomonadaceae bacterium]